MRVLLAAATSPEIAPLVERVARADIRHEIEPLITGVGMVATAAACARALAERRYDIALNVGVCGSFDPALPPGTVVHVVADTLAELGAEDGDAFLPIESLGLLHADEAATMANLSPPANAALARLPAVRGITVNTVHGSDRSIAAIAARLRPQVESMEGAAFMHACLAARVPFAQVRAVSNVVERRNREAWRLREAIDNLTAAAVEILGSL